MNYYVCSGTGSGTPADPTRPQVPAATPWVGTSPAADGTYLIATPADLSGVQGVTAVTDLAAECASRGLSMADVESWKC